MDFVGVAIILAIVGGVGWSLYRASEKEDERRRAEADRNISSPVGERAQPAKRGNGALTNGCLIALAALGGIAALGALIQVIDPEGVKERAAEAEADSRAAAAIESEKDAAKRRAGFHCLSAWDGSHRELVNALKTTLRDPDSFEHIETRITPVDDKGAHVLMMNYRARNGFGGMNVGRLAAKVNNSDCSFEILANADG